MQRVILQTIKSMFTLIISTSSTFFQFFSLLKSIKYLIITCLSYVDLSIEIHIGLRSDSSVQTFSALIKYFPLISDVVYI